MRLLNTQTYKLKTFFGNHTPHYAILSHTWGSDSDKEILFEDLQLPIEVWQSKASFTKVRGFCEVAAANAYQWVWIDTCCIDKSSSAELSEAINSMFRWYKDAGTCYVYLEDVEFEPPTVKDLQSVKSSRWFTRGWTLQELLAPKTVEFYDKNWREIGTKKSLQGTITELTGIQRDVLSQLRPLFRCTIAERMSWAANRVTTREEDIAYCLFGIFDIHMPLQYGEGQKAFGRLQEEIIKVTEDYTWLAWTIRLPKHYSVFATSPSCFARPLELEGCQQSFHSDSAYTGNGWQNQADWSKQWSKSNVFWNYSQLQRVNLANLSRTKSCVESLLIEEKGLELDEFPRLTPRGLRLTLPILKHESCGLIAFLHCVYKPAGELLCLALSKESSDSRGEYYKRADAGIVLLPDKEVSMQYKTIYLKTTPSEDDSFNEFFDSLWWKGTRRRQTILLSVGLGKSPVFLLHQEKQEDAAAHHFVFRYGTLYFRLLFGLQNDGWCYLSVDQDYAFQPVKKDKLKEFIVMNIFGRESDRAEVGANGIMIYCTMKKRNPDWIDLRASRYSPEQFGRVEDLMSLHSVDVWATPDASEQLEVIYQEKIMKPQLQDFRQLIQ